MPKLTLDTIITEENFFEYRYDIRRMDHGHAIFENGYEIEFGFIPPMLESEVVGMTIREHWEQWARTWCELDPKIKDLRINKIWLAG